MKVEKVQEISSDILDVVSRFFVGNRLMLRKLLAAGLANGHVLFEDFPGLGKTLLAKTFAKVTGCTWKRIQFTPDLMPADIIGTRVWRIRESKFVLERGPVFTNILLADEINRSPPKTQSALLESMEERQVTIEGETHRLSEPFFVIATQNPIELEGTYPLPEAQMDRFMLKLSMGYVGTQEEESMILKRRISWGKDDPTDIIEPVTDQATFVEMQRFIEEGMYVDDQIVDYITELVRLTRRHPVVEVGASPRGGLSLMKAARAHAALSRRNFVTPDDVKMFIVDALGHRMIMKMEYAIEGAFSVGAIVNEIIGKVEVPKQFMRR
ncbi:magnesium chelatase [miscellaneous Crenarchaeota group-15 archaeon DG-45]|uniref:Magnesium chelatase n=1 Tax=miscellaneous Crenarchaeota group-15 archaeon DG-45 TaxID=1685127 RepID=A0A0M0BN82_9ARCH|nr:MAG: magnesium chelatase [miscellaneous Crenarchaeota group-15 archaeon DG-45]